MMQDPYYKGLGARGGSTSLSDQERVEYHCGCRRRHPTDSRAGATERSKRGVGRGGWGGAPGGKHAVGR